MNSFSSFFFTVLFGFSALAIQAEEPKPLPPPETPKVGDESNKPVIVQKDKDTYSIGQIEFKKSTRSISFPARLELRDELIEYVLVLPKGKIHESLFVTEVNPEHLNVAFKLLSYKESRELFPFLEDGFRPTDKYPDVPEKIKKAARLKIQVSWTKDKKTVTRSLNDLIQNQITTKSMIPGPWLYTGSYVHAERYQASLSGDLIALLTTESSIVNYPGKGRLDDTQWFPFAKRLPARNTPVTITISPYPTK